RGRTPPRPVPCWSTLARRRRVRERNPFRNAFFGRHLVQARILIVEDDPAILELLRFHLDNEGFSTLSATDGRAALEAYARSRPDLVLLDLMLPGMDGLEVCRRIRKSSETPIIILTAKGQEDDRVRGLESGADDYVTKPFSPRELVARIHAVLRRS